jgi:hypothetical protein
MPDSVVVKIEDAAEDGDDPDWARWEWIKLAS